MNSIQEITYSVVVKDQHGNERESTTGFFVKDNIILTAKHLLNRYDDISDSIFVQIKAPMSIRQIECEIFFKHGDYDILLLKTKNYFSSLYQGIVKEISLPEDGEYAFFGFCIGYGEIGHSFKINSARRLRDTEVGGEDYEFYLKQSVTNLKGASGSPIYFNNMIVAMVTQQTTSPSIRSILAIRQSLIEVAEKYGFLETSPFLDSFENRLMKFSGYFIERNIKNRKYIPQIFIEMNNTKESFRYLAHPILFINKGINEIDKIDISSFNLVLETFGIETVYFSPHFSINFEDNSNFFSSVESLKKEIDQFALAIRSKDQKFGVTKNNFDFSKALFGQQFGFIFDLEKISQNMQAINQSITILKANAGQGKTNFLCDFVKKFLLVHKIPVVTFEATDIINDDIVRTINRFIESNLKLSKSDFIHIMNEEWKYRSKQFIVIVDGMNEIGNTAHFEQSVYLLKNEYEDLPWFKIILSCRDELFKERYPRIDSDAEIAKQDLRNNRSDIAIVRERVFRGYLDFFHIEINELTNIVFEELTNNYLLLRIFSETYGNEQSTCNYLVQCVEHLNLSNLFDGFLERQKERICNTTAEEITFDNIVEKIVSTMLYADSFASVDLNNFLETEINFVNKIIEESVIYKKEVKINTGFRNKTKHALGFTYDEMRDFLIANHIYEFFDSDVEFYKGKISYLTSEKHRFIVTEGLRKYLFFALKNYENKSFNEFIYHQEWYEIVLMENVFMLDDNQISNEDMLTLERKIYSLEGPYKRIITGLIYRRNPLSSDKLTIKFLFQMLANDKADAENFFTQLFSRLNWNAYNNNDFLINIIEFIQLTIMDDSIILEENKRLISLLILISSYDFEFKRLLEDCKIKYPKEFEGELQYLSDNNFI